MLTEALQDRAELYVSGAMTAAEREALEVLLEFHQELRAQVASSQEALAAAMLTRVPAVMPPAGLRDRVLQAAGAPARTEPEALVVADADGFVEWVNPAFLAMCGHSLAELKGRKPGRVLQGPDTDHAAVARIRTALRERRPCRETLVNYHKDGTRYQADVRIMPILDNAGQPLWFVAKERKLAESGVPA